MSRHTWIVFVLVAACGSDEQPIDATKSSSKSLCEFERVTCVDRGVELFFSPPMDCEESLEQWDACGLAREDVTGCVEALERCEPDPNACGESTQAFCSIPECVPLFDCQLGG